MAHTIEHLELTGLLRVRTKQFADARGIFSETWSTESFRRIGLDQEFIQDNQSVSTLDGTVRGLHYQRKPYAQAKLLRVVVGAVFDVAVDLRNGSPTFGKAVSMVLTDTSGDQIFIPKGFAHGFMTLTDNTIVNYKVDAPYEPKSEGGIFWNDPTLGIEWPTRPNSPILSEKDLALPNLLDAEL